MANTYTLIQAATVASGGTSYIEFTSIPNTYTDLLLYTSLRDDRNISLNDGTLQINGSSSNFSRLYIESTNYANATTDVQANGNFIYATTSQSTASTFSNGYMYIPNYLSNNYKGVLVQNANASNGAPVNLISIIGSWSDTSQITSLRITPEGSGVKYVEHSTAYLYGIKNS